jgi:2-aminoethylphosphonate-pyruvate transaminase
MSLGDTAGRGERRGGAGDVNEPAAGRRGMLVNPGPTNVSDDVRRALVTPDMSHRAPAFRAALARVNATVLELVNGRGTHAAVLFACSGTGANEAMVNGIRGKVLTLVAGRYGERLVRMVDRFGIPQRRLDFDRFTGVDPAAVDACLAGDPDITHVVLAHHETTTGVLAPLRAVGRVVQQHGRLLVVDGVSSVGAHPVDVQADHVAFLSLNANKCLESLPGVALVVGRRDELARLAGGARSFYFDLHAQWAREERGEIPYTAPVQVVFAFDEALRRLAAEGYDARVRRYQALAARMREGLVALGFELAPIPADRRGNVVTTVRMPAGLDFEEVTARLAAREIEVYTASELLADGYCYFATLGAIDVDDVTWFLGQLGEVLAALGCRPLSGAPGR